MTNRRRIMDVYHNRVPDQIPVAVYGRYLPRGFVERQVRGMGVGISKNFPVVSMLAPPVDIRPGYVSAVRGADLETRFTWENGEKFETRICRTPLGTLTRRIRQDPAYGSAWIVKHFVASAEDCKVARYLMENTILRRNEEAFISLREDLGEDGVVLARVDRCPFQKILIELAGPERFLAELATGLKPALQLLEALDKKMDEVFEMVCEADAEVIWQPDNITAEMVPPRYFGEFCLPYYVKQGKELHDRNKTYLVHMDGHLQAIKDLIARTPIDGVETFSFPEIVAIFPSRPQRLPGPGRSSSQISPPPWQLGTKAPSFLF